MMLLSEVSYHSYFILFRIMNLTDELAKIEFFRKLQLCVCMFGNNFVFVSERKKNINVI